MVPAFNMSVILIHKFVDIIQLQCSYCSIKQFFVRMEKTVTEMVKGCLWLITVQTTTSVWLALSTIKRGTDLSTLVVWFDFQTAPPVTHMLWKLSLANFVDLTISYQVVWQLRRSFLLRERTAARFRANFQNVCPNRRCSSGEGWKTYRPGTS